MHASKVFCARLTKKKNLWRKCFYVRFAFVQTKYQLEPVYCLDISKYFQTIKIQMWSLSFVIINWWQCAVSVPSPSIERIKMIRLAKKCIRIGVLSEVKEIPLIWFSIIVITLHKQFFDAHVNAYTCTCTHLCMWYNLFVFVELQLVSDSNTCMCVCVCLIGFVRWCSLIWNDICKQIAAHRCICARVKKIIFFPLFAQNKNCSNYVCRYSEADFLNKCRLSLQY